MPRGVYERKPRTAKADKPAKVAKPEKIKKIKKVKADKADKAPKEPKIKVPRLPKGAGRIARKIANSAVDVVTQRSFGYQSELIKDRFQIFESAISTKMFNIYDHLAIARDGLPGDHIRDLNGEVVFFDNFEEARKFLTHS